MTCDPQDREPLYKTAPCLVAEVLSPMTEVVGRREKLIAYRTLPTLRDYPLVAQDCRRVERYRRTEAGDWRHEIVEDGLLAFSFGTVTVQFTVADLYEDVELEAAQTVG